MSTTSYQTNAKPRGRRGSHGEAPDKPSRSRASSSASTKLSKTLSRTLDEVSVPRNNRPASPVVHLYRQRGLDSKLADQGLAWIRHPTGSLRAEKPSQPRSDDDRVQPSGSPTRPRAQTTHEFHHGPPKIETTEPAPRPLSPPDVSKYFVPEPAETVSDRSDVQSVYHPPYYQGLGRKTQSSRSLTSMQPTVAEESEDLGVLQPIAVPLEPPAPMPAPVLVEAATENKPKSVVIEQTRPVSPGILHPFLPEATTLSLGRKSISSLLEEDAGPSPRMSKSSLYDLGSQLLPRSSGSISHEPLVAPSPQGPVSFIQPHLDQRLAGFAESEIPASLSPIPAAEVSMLQEYIPQTHSPIGSPPLSPFTYQQIGSPPPLPLQYQQPYPYTHPPSFVAGPHFPPAFYPAPFISPPVSFSHPGEIPRTGSAGAEDEGFRLLEKVSNVLPDLNRLLRYYQESHGLLSEKDNLVKQAANQHLEETARLRVELSACKEEYEKVMGQQASENLRLRGEVVEQAEKIAILQGPSHGVADSGGEAERLRNECNSLREEVQNGISTNERLAAEKKLLEDETNTLKQQLHETGIQYDRQHAELRHLHGQEIAAKEEEQAKLQHEHKVGLSKIQLDLAGMITNHTHLKKDLESARTTISEHEQSLTSKTQELEEVLRSNSVAASNMHQVAEEESKRHQQEKLVLLEELSQLAAKHEQARKAAEERMSDIIRDHEHREAEHVASLRIMQIERDGLQRKLEEEHSTQIQLRKDLTTAQEAHETLRAGNAQNDKHHAELAEIVINLRNKQAEWQRESERMDRIVDSLRQVSSGQPKSEEPLSIPGTYR